MADQIPGGRADTSAGRRQSGCRPCNAEHADQGASLHRQDVKRGARVCVPEPTASTREPDSQGFEADRKTDRGRVFPAHRSSETEVNQKTIPEDLFPDDGHPVFRESKAVRFRFFEKAPWAFPVERLCQVMNVSPRGLRAFRSRSASPLSVSVSALVAVPSAPRCQVPPAEPRPEASP